MKKFATVALVAALGVTATSVSAQTKRYDPGATDSEVKIGQTMPYSGPASAYSLNGKAMVAYFHKINDEGGVNGRKINLISLDDAFSPPKTVEQTRRLVDNDEVLALVGAMGTAPSMATLDYLTDEKIPSLFIISGAEAFADPKTHPWSMGFQPTNAAQGAMFANYILKERPNAKIAILYQNDDFGKDHLKGFREALGNKADSMIVKSLTYDISQPTIDSEILILKASGADVLLDIANPKFTAQAIKKITETKWDVLHVIATASSSIASVLRPAGVENSKGVVSVAFRKDPNDPAWKDDPGMNDYRAFMKQYMQQFDPADTLIVNGYTTAQAFVAVLKASGDELTRENLMKQAASMKNVVLPMLLPGIEINTGPNDYAPIEQAQVVQFDGEKWVPVGGVVSAR